MGTNVAEAGQASSAHNLDDLKSQDDKKKLRTARMPCRPL